MTSAQLLAKKPRFELTLKLKSDMIDEAKKQGFNDTSSLLTNVYHICLKWKKEKHCKNGQLFLPQFHDFALYFLSSD